MGVTTALVFDSVCRLDCYVHPKFVVYRSVDVDAMPQQRAVFDGCNHQTKLPIHRRQTWFSAAAILTLPNLQLSAISVVELRQVLCEEHTGSN